MFIFIINPNFVVCFLLLFRKNIFSFVSEGKNIILFKRQAFFVTKWLAENLLFVFYKNKLLLHRINVIKLCFVEDYF
jgi:hypothetical protein